MPPRRRSDARAWRRLGREDGQTFVFMATMLFGLLVVVATVINVGQAVNRRIMLQMAADAGAYTGATEMARGMNTMAEHNARIQRGWQKLNAVFKWYVPCVISSYAVTAFDSLQGWETEIINAVNQGYGKRALGEAQRVTQYNIGDLFPARPTGSERVEFSEGDPALAIGIQRPRGYVVWTEEVPEGVAPKAGGGPSARKKVRYECLEFRPKPVRVKKSAAVGLWYRKVKGSDPVAFVWVVKASATRARVFDDVFGPNLIPEMTAVSVAKPVGGDIEKGDAKYVAKLIPVRDLLGGVIDRWNSRWRTVAH